MIQSRAVAAVIVLLCLFCTKKQLCFHGKARKVKKSVDVRAVSYYCLIKKWIHYQISTIRRNERWIQ